MATFRLGAINVQVKTTAGPNVERNTVAVEVMVGVFAGLCGPVKGQEAGATPTKVLVHRRVNTVHAGRHVNVFVIGN